MYITITKHGPTDPEPWGRMLADLTASTVRVLDATTGADVTQRAAQALKALESVPAELVDFIEAHTAGFVRPWQIDG